MYLWWVNRRTSRISLVSVSFAANHQKNCHLQTDTHVRKLLSHFALLLLSTIKCNLVDQYLKTEVYNPKTSCMNAPIQQMVTGRFANDHERFEILLRLFGCQNCSGPSRNAPLVDFCHITGFVLGNLY